MFQVLLFNAARTCHLRAQYTQPSLICGPLPHRGVCNWLGMMNNMATVWFFWRHNDQNFIDNQRRGASGRTQLFGSAWLHCLLGSEPSMCALHCPPHHSRLQHPVRSERPLLRFHCALGLRVLLLCTQFFILTETQWLMVGCGEWGNKGF